jgi:hypothetical protein
LPEITISGKFCINHQKGQGMRQTSINRVAIGKRIIGIFTLCVFGVTVFVACNSKNPVAPVTTTYQLTVQAGTGGMISVPSSSPVTVNNGAATTITTIPFCGFNFVKWTVVSGTATIADSSLTTTTVVLSSGDATVRADFVSSVLLFQLTVIAGAGGTITAPATQTIATRLDSTIIITAKANPGYVFSEWTDTSGNAVITFKNSASTTVKLSSGNATLQAGFIPIVSALTPIDISAFEKEQGANFKYYKGSWTALPDFFILTPDSSGPCDSIEVTEISHQSSNFGFVFDGYLSIPMDGEYTFYLKSSDGSVLLLNDSVIIRNDGIHSLPVEDSVVITLKQGTYLIGVQYFNAGSSSFLNVSYAYPSFGIDKQTISNQSLQRPSTAPVPKITITAPAGGETYNLGDIVHVQWTYKNSRAQVFVGVSVDSGKSYQNICNLALPTTVNSYDWQIPIGSDSLITQSAFIKVEEYPPFTLFGVSNSFSIAVALAKRKK